MEIETTTLEYPNAGKATAEQMQKGNLKEHAFESSSQRFEYES